MPATSSGSPRSLRRRPPAPRRSPPTPEVLVSGGAMSFLLLFLRTLGAIW
jgi:hypothetical protein